MPNSTELPKLPPKILLYGPAGGGKTALCGTLGKRAQLIDTDRGWTTFNTLDDKFKAARQAVDIIQCYDERADVATALGKAKQAIFNVSAQCAAKTYKWDALVVDNLSTMGQGAVKQVKGFGPGNLTQAQWGLALIEMENILIVLRSLPIPVIVIAHTLAVEVNKIPTIKPYVIGAKLPEQLPTWFDEVWYANAQIQAGGVRKYYLYTKTSDILARSRLGLPDVTDQDLGLEEILRKVGYEFPIRQAEPAGAQK